MTGEKTIIHFQLNLPLSVFATACLLSLILPCFCSYGHPHKLLPSQELDAKSLLEVDTNGSYKSLVNRVYKKKKKKAENSWLGNAAKHHYNFSAFIPHNYYIF